MLERRIGGVPVVNGRGELRGIITESDFAAKDHGFPFALFSLYRQPQVLGQWLPPEGVERIYEAARTRTAREIMSTEVVIAREDEPVEAVLKMMLRNEVHRVPVVRDRIPIGMVTRHDLLRMLVRRKTDKPTKPKKRKGG